jgi:hypothetical protein
MRTCSQVTVHVEASPRGDLRPRCRHTDLVVHPRVRAGRMARRRPALFRGMSRTSCRAGRGSARLSSPTAVREFSFRTAPSRRTRLDHVVLPLRAAGDRTDVTESYGRQTATSGAARPSTGSYCLTTWTCAHTCPGRSRRSSGPQKPTPSATRIHCSSTVGTPRRAHRGADEGQHHEQESRAAGLAGHVELEPTEIKRTPLQPVM